MYSSSAIIKWFAGLLTVILCFEYGAIDQALAADLNNSVSTSTVSTTSSIPAQASSTAVIATTTPEHPLIVEPTIRVGLYKTNQAVLFRSDFPYEVFAGAESQGTLDAGEEGKLDYDAGIYRFSGNGIDVATTTYLKLVPANPREQFFTILSYDRRVAGRGGISFNVYRGALEYRFSSRSQLPYVINELPLENYVAGIAESDDHVPAEYAKALLTAARTYAYVHIHNDAPNDNHLFDVFATTLDQTYLGYNSEISMPHIAAAATTTAGEMVTFESQPVITLYFGHSSGHTRSWPGKGTNSRPWLKSVKAKYDKGKKMWGHGYGMSTHDAELRAKKDGWTAEQILKYYYHGVEIEKIY